MYFSWVDMASHRRTKRWCQDDMETALSLISDGLTVPLASEMTNVPRRTLGYRLAKGYYYYVAYC